MIRGLFRGATVMVLFLLGGTAIAGAGPQIQADQLKYDFGKVKAGGLVEHVFEIRNSGDELLVVQKVQSP